MEKPLVSPDIYTVQASRIEDNTDCIDINTDESGAERRERSQLNNLNYSTTESIGR